MDIFTINRAVKKAKRYTDSVALNGVPVRTPQIDAISKHWLVFDPVQNAFVDTGVRAVGKDGKSAYEIAVDNGFQGTPAEWLKALQGEDGEDALQPDIREAADKVSITYDSGAYERSLAGFFEDQTAAKTFFNNIAADDRELYAVFINDALMFYSKDIQGNFAIAESYSILS